MASMREPLGELNCRFAEGFSGLCWLRKLVETFKLKVAARIEIDLHTESDKQKLSSN